jgi:dTDP-glucose 4,6-dehydratase
MIVNAIAGKKLPIYGDGGNIRDWLFVEDHCAGIALVLRRGRLGETYNIGGDAEMANINLVGLLCKSSIAASWQISLSPPASHVVRPRAAAARASS